MNNSLLSFLLEGVDDKEDSASDDKKDSTDSNTDKANKDITDGKEDLSKDSKDSLSTDNNDEDTSSDDLDSSDDSDTNDAVAADDNADDSDKSVNLDEFSEDEKRNSLFIYSKFKQLVMAFKTIEATYKQISQLDLPASNNYVVQSILDKILRDIEYLDKLLLDIDFFMNKSYKDLLTIFNIYLSDLRVIDENLRSFIKSNKITNKKPTKK